MQEPHRVAWCRLCIRFDWCQSSTIVETNHLRHVVIPQGFFFFVTDFDVLTPKQTWNWRSLYIALANTGGRHRGKTMCLQFWNKYNSAAVASSRSSRRLGFTLYFHVISCIFRMIIKDRICAFWHDVAALAPMSRYPALHAASELSPAVSDLHDLRSWRGSSLQSVKISHDMNQCVKGVWNHHDKSITFYGYIISSWP